MVLNELGGSLEDRLKQLKTLEVVDVEQVIGDIERTKIETKSISDSVNLGYQEYRRILEEKLPKIIENIQNISGAIFGLGQECYQFDYSGFWSTLSLIQRKNGSLLLGLNNRAQYPASGRNRIDIVFDTDRYIESISLPTGFVKRGKIPFFSREKPTYFVKEKTPYEFTDKYIDLVISYLKIGGESDFDLVPFILNSVPSFIRELYEIKKNKKQDKLKSIQSKIKKIDSLSISDII